MTTPLPPTDDTLASLREHLYAIEHAQREVRESWRDAPAGPLADAVGALDDALRSIHAIATHLVSLTNDLAIVSFAQGQTMGEHLMNHHTIGD